MNHRLIITCVALLCLAGTTARHAQAQRTSADRDRSGTASSAYLLLPLTARTAGLGATSTSGLAGMNGLEASLENPAALTLNGGTTALFSRMNYVADIGINHFGVAHRFGNSNIGLSISAWDFGDIPIQTVENPDITETTPTWTATYVTAGLSYAQQFTDRIAAGVTAKVVSENMASDLSGSTVAFDAGMTYVVGESGLRFGVSLRNFGPAMRYDGSGLATQATPVGGDTPAALAYEAEDFELPSLLNFGVAYSRDVGAGSVVTVLGNFRSNAYEEDQFSGGLELGLRNILFVRGGYQYQSDLDSNFFAGWNVGGGLNLDVSGVALSVDYAYRGTEDVGNVQIITAIVTL